MRLTLFFLLLLTGCAQAPKPLVSSPSHPKNRGQLWQHHQERLLGIPHWQAEGRLAVSQGQKGNNASFVWQQKGEAYFIKFFGPFGAGSAYLIGTPGKVKLQEANGKVTLAQSPELLLQKVAGWQVPLTGLGYWLRGIPIPRAEVTSQQLDDQGLLRVIQQQGWRIDYEDYIADNAGPLPKKLRLQNGDLKIKMVVTSWKNLAPT